MRRDDATTRASVIITNHNYAEYVGEAIESALAQTYPSVEVVVVDDGSTDGSIDVIEGYEDRVTVVRRDCGGQTSAMNAGFAVSTGDVVCFLDADDVLEPAAMERAVALLSDPGIAKVHWPLREVDSDGRPLGSLLPRDSLPEGHIIDRLLGGGPQACGFPPTSGNAWSRQFLESVLPLPEFERQLGVGSASADALLSMLAPFAGRVGRIAEPQGSYRVHGGNDYAGTPFIERVNRHVAVAEVHFAFIERYAAERGIVVETARWRHESWFHRIHDAMHQIALHVPPGGRFVLVDDNQLGDGELVPGRTFVRLGDRDGHYWGPPGDEGEVIAELHRAAEQGATAVAFLWDAFWWFDHYPRALSVCLRGDWAASRDVRVMGLAFAGATAAAKGRAGR